MKIITRTEFLSLPSPVSYIRFSNLNVKNAPVEIKISGDENGFHYQYMWSLTDPTEAPEIASDWVSIEAQKRKMLNGESIEFKPEAFQDDGLEDMFVIFEMNDMQHLIIPLVECFDLAKQLFFKERTH